MGGKRQLTHEEFMRKVIDTNEYVRCGDVEVLGIYTRSSDKIECRCNKHNLVWHPYADSLYKGIGCRKCGAEKTSQFVKKAHENFVNELRELDDSILVLSEYIGAKDPITIQFKCGHVWTTAPNNILHNNRECPYCSGYAVLRGFNDLWTVDKTTASLLTNPNDGYILTRMSGQKKSFTCPLCGHTQNKTVSNVAKRGLSCDKCSDHLSYPSKFTRAFFDMLPIDDYDVEWQPDWAKPYLYDFHIKFHDQDIIIEVDGGFHYLEVTQSHLSLEERQKIDEIKNNLAKDNNVKIIRIDAKESNCEYITNSIMNSELSDMFDLSEINWNECNVKSQKSLVKLVCDYYTETHLKSKEIARHFKLAPTTVVSYLKRGMKIGWCTYNPQDYYGYKVVSKAVTVLNINNNECHYFDSMSICKRIMRQTYGVKLKHEQIKKACESKTPYKGFIFEFVKQTIQN